MFDLKIVLKNKENENSDKDHSGAFIFSEY